LKKSALKWYWVGALGIAFVVLLYLSATLTHRYLHRTIESLGNTLCSSCLLTIDHLKFQVFPLAVNLNGIILTGGDPNTTALKSSAKDLWVKISWINFFTKRIIFSEVKLDTPIVKVIEGDLPLVNTDSTDDQKEDQKGDEQGWTFAIESTTLTHAEFTYIRRYQSRMKQSQPSRLPMQAELNIKNISAIVSRIDSASDACEDIVNADLTAVLENSGHFTLKIKSSLCAEKHKIDVNLHLFKQNLNSVSDFFVSSSGVGMKGFIHDAWGEVRIHGQSSKTNSTIRYQDLALKFRTTDERGFIVTAFSNALQAISLHTSNLGRIKSDQTQSVELVRKSDETIISFVLRGLQEAALKIAKNKKSKRP
jgi:hypothetical protein